MQVACPHCQAVLNYGEKRPVFCSQCGQALRPSEGESTRAFDAGATGPQVQPTADAEAPPEIIGGYRLLRPLGKGGMGTVYEAEDTASGRRVALKLIAPDYAESSDAIERFRREGRLASTLAHPRCVFVLAADEEAGRPYLVMELMPGRTLEDLVTEQGPMTPAAALACVLDVLDGLQEAHRLGFIHRDVKPSNCFLDADGRVKVGDFGLAKSLVSSDRLTRTGSFLGTLLFAAPEQIKGETLDPQTDVYAVSATLYYLLTGRAPFAGGDAAATLARTVSEPAPPMRNVRPELDPALDAVVLRGLERERTRRWRSLVAFKAALAPFLPSPLPVATLGIRFVAYLLDCLILLLIYALVAVAFNWQVIQGGPDRFEEMAGITREQALSLALDVLYFVLLEGLWGASLGKRLLRLRVRRASTNDRPGLGRIVLRSLVFIGLLELGYAAQVLGVLALRPPGVNEETWARTAPLSFVFVHLLPLLGVLGILLLLAPMRTRNGYRGLHEWLSDTRTVGLPRPDRRRVLTGRSREWSLSQPSGMPVALGPFLVHGAIRWEENAKVLLGQDRGLGRSVWIWLRPASDPPLSAGRRDISRPTRLRWLACGRHADWQWDAFMAFNGGPLPRPSRRREESWPRALPLLEQLTEELVRASAEDTLPDTLPCGQVWVGPDGQCQLIDIPLNAPEAGAASGPHRALALLAYVAAWVLEGQPRAARATDPVRAPIPLRARPGLDRLLGAGKPYLDVAEFHTALQALADAPAETTAPRRAQHLAIQAALLFLGMGCCMLPAGYYNQFFPLAILAGSIDEKERGLTDLEQGAMLDFASRAFNPDPVVRLQALVQLEADYQLRDRLQESLDHDRQLHDARLQSSSWLSRNAIEQMEKQNALAESKNHEAAQAGEYRERSVPEHFRRRAQRLTEGSSLKERELPPAWFWLVPLLTWPALWGAWAFLARGGISYRLAGIALVRGDGRPASRLQCAGRALLTWLPLTGLLVLSFWLEERYWSLWQPDASPRWLFALASAVWYASLLLLAGYVLLALWQPARALHDRLSGVYIVPR